MGYLHRLDDPYVGRLISHAENIEENNEISRTTFNSGLEVRKDISLNYGAFFINRNAQHDLNLAILRNEIQTQNIVYQIIRNYVSVLENQKRLSLLQENIVIQESIVAESNLLYRQARITQFEVQQSEINLLNAQISAMNARNNLNLSRTRLFDLINIEDSGRELAEVTLFVDEDALTFTRELDINNVLSVMVQEETVARHRTSLTRTRLDFLPDITLSYRFSENNRHDTINFTDYHRNHTIGLNLSFSTNRLFRTHFDMRERNLLDEHMSLNTSQLIRDINMEFYQHFEELNFLSQMNSLLNRQEQQTTENLEMAMARYRLGLLTQLDIDRARYESLNARINLEVNQYQLILRKLSIDHLLSNDLVRLIL
jgi:outer membrane protein